MKKIVLAAAVGGMLAAGVAMAATAAEKTPGAKYEPPVFDIPKMDGIVVDGKPDDWGERGFRVETMTTADGKFKPPADLDAAFRLGWTEQGLVILLTVRDNVFTESDDENTLYSKDSVELYLVNQLGGAEMIQAVIAPGMDGKHAAPRVHVYDNRKDANLKKAPPVVQAARSKVEGGYMLEALLPWAAVGVTPKPGTEAALQVFVNDCDGEGLMNLVWYPAVGAFKDTTRFRRVRLAERAGPPDLAAVREGVDDTNYWVEVVGPAGMTGKPVALRIDFREAARGTLAAHDGRCAARLVATRPRGSWTWARVEVLLDGAVAQPHLPVAAENIKTMIVAEPAAVRLAIRDLIATFGDRYAKGGAYLARLDALDRQPEGAEKTEALLTLQREALLANPLLDFDRILLVKRGEKSPALGLMINWQSNSSLPRQGYDDEIAVLSGYHTDGKLSTLFRPGGRFVGDVDLHWDADKLLFSMPGEKRRWQVCEIGSDGTGFRELPLIAEPDVDNYDACYLPDGRIIFTSTACFQGVPCVNGSDHVSNLYLFNPGDRSIRRLTFDQDHDWCPTVLNNGRVLYLRWEYADLPHFFSRILFHMNPDGTEQMEFYGSNSYWPNANFYARPCPNHPTRFVGIVSGHHGVRRMGELVLFDAAQGRREAAGVVQRIPGRDKPVEPKILDDLVDASWPKFLHPWPLSDKYILVACKPTPLSLWGLYLVDVFDNILLIKEDPSYALLEPIPFKKTAKPPVIPDKVNVARKDGVVYMVDVYAGNGLKGVPRGTVKKLRLFTYQFAYQGRAGLLGTVGHDGPWDVKRILGTVPVEPDGSACFRVPANTPISVQPLDEEGKALQLMRSWMVAMPGENLSCVGCHESQNTSPPNRPARAFANPPADIAPWYGPTRGFSFKREVQPVLDRYCVGCHKGAAESPAGARTLPNFLAGDEQITGAYKGVATPAANMTKPDAKFSPSYIALRACVRGHTIESDMHLLDPCEFHADTTELVQKLRKGHHGVQLDPEAWDRLIAWIDLNTPYYGTWHEIFGQQMLSQRDRRQAMDKLYAGRDEDPEAVYPVSYKPPESPLPQVVNRNPKIEDPKSETNNIPGWPFDAAEAQKRQAALGEPSQTVDLGGGVKLELVRIPAGEFLMGDAAGDADERTVARVKIDKSFWMGKFEVMNEQFALFDPGHDSRVEHRWGYLFSVESRGDPVNGRRQPVCRVSWNQAMAFCKWLSEKTGRIFTLPTEAQWEWACRSGASTDSDFARFANLGWNSDGFGVSAPVGAFAPNAWGLHDMAGNVWEWTQGTDRSAQTGPSAGARRVVRGCSWYTRPERARSASRLGYPPWQGVYDVGFRVVCETNGAAVTVADQQDQRTQ